MYKGTPSAAESAFWEAVRNGDDAAREAAVAKMRTDVAADPTNGYSAFLSGASTLMPSAALPRALAAGQPLSMGGGAPPFDPGPLFKQSLEHLTDPLYIGFADILLSFVQLRAGDMAGAGQSQKAAFAHNVPASSVGVVNGQLIGGDVAGARDTMLAMLDFCNGSPVDRQKPDLAAFVDKANASGLAHRECYSGYFGPHATEGELLLVGDLHAASGNGAVAVLYYQAMNRATSYATWPLRPLAERRLSGAQPVQTTDLSAIAACTTCHTNTLP